MLTFFFETASLSVCFVGLYQLACALC